MSEGNDWRPCVKCGYTMTRLIDHWECERCSHTEMIAMEPEKRPWEDLAAKMLQNRLSSLDVQLNHLLDVLPDDWEFFVVHQGALSWVEVRPPSSDGWQTVAEGRAKREEVDHE